MHTDGRWNLETVENPVTWISALHEWARSALASASIGTHSLPGGQVAYRVLAPGERLFARDPREDGLSFAARSAGRPALYPWAAWCDGRWHLAVQGEDF